MEQSLNAIAKRIWFGRYPDQGEGAARTKFGTVPSAAKLFQGNMLTWPAGRARPGHAVYVSGFEWIPLPAVGLQVYVETVGGCAGRVLVKRLDPIEGERYGGERRRTQSWPGSVVALVDTKHPRNVFDPAGGRWATVCVTHSTVCNHETHALAEYHLIAADWCEACQEKLAAGEAEQQAFDDQTAREGEAALAAVLWEQRRNNAAERHADDPNAYAAWLAGEVPTSPDQPPDDEEESTVPTTDLTPAERERVAALLTQHGVPVEGGHIMRSSWDFEASPEDHALMDRAAAQAERRASAPAPAPRPLDEKRFALMQQLRTDYQKFEAERRALKEQREPLSGPERAAWFDALRDLTMVTITTRLAFRRTVAAFWKDGR